MDTRIDYLQLASTQVSGERRVEGEASWFEELRLFPRKKRIALMGEAWILECRK